MQAYISSKANQTLLHNYAYKTLMSEWPSQRAALSNAIDASLETCSELGPFYAAWSVTKENIATVNVEIWKKLKVLVTQAMNGSVVDHVFVPRESYVNESSVEPSERTSIHEDLYKKKW